MNRTWVVVANAARARLCEFDPRDGSLTELADFTHPAGRQKGSDLATDRPGHAAKGQTGSRTSFEPHTEVHHKERATFAHELAQHLELAVVEGRCPALALIASNPFLGELKARLGPGATRAIAATSPTDLTHCTMAELAQRVGALLQDSR
jgi:protein required for attachment to host cells